MSSQSQSQFFPRSAVVQELEDRLAAPGKHPEIAPTYQQLCRDPAVVLAARYLALSAIANKLNLYSASSTAGSLIQEISDHMNAVDPNKLLASIQHLKQYYPSLYRMNTLAFDTASNTAVDCIHRVAPQATVAAAPISNAQADVAPPPVKDWEQALPPMDFVPPLVTATKYPVTHPDRRPVILGGSLVASSVIAGTLFLLSRNNLPQSTQPTTAIVSPSALPSPTLQATMANSPLALPSVTPTVFPSYSASPVQTPSLPSTAQGQSLPQSSPASVIPIPIPTRTTKAVSASPTNNTGNSAQQTPSDRATTNSTDRLESVPPIAASNMAANRPSTTGFISRYYAKLKNGQSQNAWQDLAPSLQNDRQANPGGYGGEYAQWWKGLGQRTQVGKVETVQATAETAVVQAHCRHGQESYIAEYYLIFDQTSQSWKINRIKKLS
jgi:hypothetical protein